MDHSQPQPFQQQIDLDLISRHKLYRISKQETFKQANSFRFSTLTKRELEVLQLLAKDLNNPQIADRLSISRFTVEQHRKNINRKLGSKSTIQLLQFALAFDLV